VSLVAPEAVEAYKTAITAAYQAKYNLTPVIYVCSPAAGARQVA